jgi:hypothetical protein
VREGLRCQVSGKSRSTAADFRLFTSFVGEHRLIVMKKGVGGQMAGPLGHADWQVTLIDAGTSFDFSTVSG